MANMFNNDGMVDWVVNKTPLLVPSFGNIQAQNGHPVTENTSLEIPSITTPLNPMSYEEMKANEAQMVNEGFLDPSAPPTEEISNTGFSQQTTPEGPVDTGDRAANDMIATLKQLDDGTLKGAEIMVQNFERVAQEYAQRTGRNMQGDLFMPNYDQKLETNYAPFLNARNY